MALLLSLLSVLCSMPICGHSESNDVRVMWYLHSEADTTISQSELATLRKAFDDALYALGENTTPQNVSYEVSHACTIRNGNYGQIKEQVTAIAQQTHQRLINQGYTVSGWKKCTMQVSVQTKLWSPEYLFVYDYANPKP